MNCGLDAVRQRSDIIKQCAEDSMNKLNLSTLQRTVSIDNNSENEESRINVGSYLVPRPAELNSSCILMQG